MPQFLLRNFVDSAGFLWVHDSVPGRIWTSRPANVCVERGLYSVIASDGTRDDDTIEERHAAHENEGKVVVDKIILAAREARCPHLTAAERWLWDDFCWRLANRGPENRDLITKDVFDDEYWETLETRMGRSLTDEERLKVLDPKEQERIVQRCWAETSLSSPTTKIRELMGSAGLRIVVADGNERSFVIGSGSPLVDGYLPLAVDVGVQFDENSQSGVERLSLAEMDEVRRRNLLVLRCNGQIVGRSFRLLQSLSNSR